MDCFLELEGVDGEAKDATYGGKIKVLGWSWGGNQPGGMDAITGGGMGTASVSFHELSVSKDVDKASPTLWQKMTHGDHIPTGKIVSRKAGGTPLDYVIIEMKQVYIVNVSLAAGGGNLVQETISLAFKEFNLKYVPQKTDGSGDAAVEWAWNIETHEDA